MFLRLKADNLSLDAIYNRLQLLYSNKLAKEVFEDMKNPEEIFQYYKLPACGNCANCPVNGECDYPQWKSVMEKASVKMNDYFLDQMSLSNIMS